VAGQEVARVCPALSAAWAIAWGRSSQPQKVLGCRGSGMCQEKTSSYRILRGRIAIDARSGQLPRTTVEDECWRSQSGSDHRLDGGVRPLNTTFGFG
jgi:hypothetical protein